ncbi:flagellar assembly protein FliH [Massilia timonae]|uniref:Flagellar assembly protein FliH n=1 Tax=Massilia timonae TaxID=47229 RepID=A0A1S2NF98_9BURK|nr:flagellar assembly protein FliH [Massilia timonae]OIJ43708.1 flagellar assembly FliH family protein [Massilia timonae]
MAIPKEQQSAYQRWEMASFGDDRPSTLARRAAEAAAASSASPSADATSALPPGFNLPSVEELEAMREAARQEGFAQGLEEGRAQGHHEGRAQGYAEGAEAGQREAAAELEQLRQVAASFGDAIAQANETISRDVLELALRLARGMVRTGFDVRPELILSVVRDAIDQLPVLQQPAVLTLNPLDAELVRHGMAEELSKGGWRIVENGSIARGGCKVETATNQIDAQAAARWNRLTHALGANVEWLGD